MRRSVCDTLRTHLSHAHSMRIRSLHCTLSQSTLKAEPTLRSAPVRPSEIVAIFYSRARPAGTLCAQFCIVRDGRGSTAYCRVQQQDRDTVSIAPIGLRMRVIKNGARQEGTPLLQEGRKKRHRSYTFKDGRVEEICLPKGSIRKAVC